LRLNILTRSVVASQ